MFLTTFRPWRGLLLLCVLLLPGLLFANTLSENEFNRLSAQLKDARPQMRQQAVIELGNSGDPRAAQAVMALRFDPDPGVRGSTASALGACRNLIGLETLRALLADKQPGVRASAARALGNLAYPESWIPPRPDGRRVDRETARKAVELSRHIELLADALKDDIPFVRVSASSSLDALGDMRGTTWLLDNMRAKDPLIRRNIYWEFARTMNRRSARVVDIALELLPKESDPSASQALVELLGASRDQRVFDPLVAVMKKNARLCPSVIRALYQIPDPRVFDTVIAYRQHADQNVRAAVALTLGGLDTPRAVDYLLPLVNDDERAVQQVAMQSLSRYSDQRVLPVLLKALDDDRFAGSRWNIILVLGKTGDPAYIEPILRFKDDPQLCQAVFNALGAMKDPRASQAIIDALHSENEAQRQAAGNVLQQQSLENLPIETLILMAQDPSKETRRRAIEYLGYKRDDAAFDTLLAALKDADPWVRRQAIYGLEMLRGPRALTEMRPMMQADADPGVRASAIRTVLRLSTEAEATTVFQEMIKKHRSGHARRGAFRGALLGVHDR